MYEQEAVFLINNKNLTSFGNYKTVACCIKLPVMETLVLTVMTAVDLASIEQLL